MSKKMIFLNWKLNPVSLKEAQKLFLAIQKLKNGKKKSETIILAPFIYLDFLKRLKPGSLLGAQNCFGQDPVLGGAFTGEVSASMLYNIGLRYVLLGHSERKALGETNLEINKKLKVALAAGLRPVLCVGEKERDAEHQYFQEVEKELEECLIGLNKNSLEKLIIAYEPVWAISGQQNKPATLEDFLEMNLFIRKILNDKFGFNLAKNIKIIYGGSVDEKNAFSFLINQNVAGLLIGKASLNPKKIGKILEICETLNK